MTVTREKILLVDLTERFLAAGRFDGHTQAAFSQAFHRHYPNAPLGERVRASELLCRANRVPLDVLTLLCCDNSKVASPVLSYSKNLSEADLTTQILQGGTEERKAIALRTDLNSVLISQLLSFAEQSVAQVLFSNHALRERITERQWKRTERLAGGAIGQTGQQAMTTDKDKLDALVSSMEMDWAAHYQPGPDVAPADAQPSEPVFNREPVPAMAFETNTDAPAPQFEAPSDAFMQPADEPVTFDNAPSSFDIEPDAPVATDDASSFLDDNDMALLEQLGGEDWDQLDDDAIEALARSLAVTDLAATEQQGADVAPEQPVDMIEAAPMTAISDEQTFAGLDDADLQALAKSLAEEDLLELDTPETTSLQGVYQPEFFEADINDLEDWDGERRLSFRIGVDDEQNAPIPPLERLDPNSRAATISFRGSQMPQEDEIDTVAVAAPEPVASEACAQANFTIPAVAISEPAHQVAAAPQPQPEQMITPVKPASEKSGERKAQITLTIRKRSEDSDQNADITTPERAARVQLSSATEDDWQQALSWLQREVVPYSKTSRTAPAPKQEPAKPGAVATAAPAQPTVKSVEIPAEFDVMSLPKMKADLPQLADATPEAEPIAADAPEVIEEPVFDAPVAAEPIVVPASAPLPNIIIPAQQSEAQGPLVHEHAPMGFMPDMVSFEGLDLVEAEPDLPSVSDLLLDQHKRRSAPVVEIVEPVELAFIEDGKITSIDEMQFGPMQVVVEQLAAERRAAEESVKPAMPHVSASLVQRAEELKAEMLATTAKQSDDMTDLPSMAQHHLVDAEEFSVLRSMEAKSSPAEAAESTEAPTAQAAGTVTVHETPSVSLREIIGSNLNAEGMAETFYAYDEESRLTLLQSIIANTLVEAAHLEHDITNRAMLSDDQAQSLVMARFGNNRIALTELLHDLSGHRRVDLTQLLQDKGGEALVVYLYHIGLDESGTLSMLLHGPDAVSHNYNKIAQLMTLYNQLYPMAAERIVTQLFGRGHRANVAAHQPLHDAGSGAASPRLRKDGQTAQTDQSGQKAPVFGRRVGFTE
ncbi:DUF2336 domain-containing protein [uncultured Cohaesibacter sp.]|uniref:DUF2336 domain-containing protein n=1 Tax=uncultured Cohaesibacter sp. TaxID=1002546 RepID=UPI0029C88ED1|nr:DUF2336 domain-containing protein [uncultured Cohaesibacter sp.]